MRGQKNDPEKTKERKETLRRLRSEAWHEIRPLALGSIAMFASSFSNQAFPRLMGRLIDQTSSKGDCHTTSSSLSLGSSLGLVVLGGGLASFVRTTLLGRAQDSIATRLRNQAFHSLMIEKDIEWFQVESVLDETLRDPATSSAEPSTGVSPGAVGDILNEDVSKISQSLTSTLANILRSSSSVVFSTYHMLTLSPQLFAVSATVIPMVGVAAIVLRKSMKRLIAKQRDLATQIASYVEERLTNINVVKLSNREFDEVQQYYEMQEESLRLGKRASLQNGLFMGFIFISSAGGLFLVVHEGGKSVASGRMTSGQLTTFATYSFLLGLGTSGITKALGEFMQGIVSAERFYKLVDKNKSDSDSDAAEAGNDVDMRNIFSISLEQVCFRYKSTGKQVLNDVSFELKRGSVVALVGKNGSGKSTTASILAGLFKPSSGVIKLSDGTNLATLSKASKKRLVQVIPQSVALFNTSILENSRYSNPEANEEQVREALKLAKCDDFVSRLENDVQFVVGVNGNKLSGGERQRLALARALLSDPAVLILDEPASSLDAEGESAVAEAILACRSENGQDPSRALLLITHQTKSLALADTILVMKDGAIVEVGAYEELRQDSSSELRKLMPDLA